MKCPKCKKSIKKVIVVSECAQDAKLIDDEINDYEDCMIGDTLRVHCEDCMEDITKLLKKKGVNL